MPPIPEAATSPVARPTVVAVNRAHSPNTKGPHVGSIGRSGIDKRPAPGRVGVHSGADPGLDGDLVADRRHHGGVDQALYLYAAEDAKWWSRELARDITPGMFGENLTTRGLDLTSAVIGEQWAIGSTRLEVSVPRIPCGTFQRFWAVPQLQKRFTAHGAPGAYVRVLQAGDVGAGDEIVVVERPDHGVTIGEVFRALTGDRSLAARLLQAPQLPDEAKDRARRWVASARRAATAG